MSSIQIICTTPGIRRNGIAHPASEIYPADRWSIDELKAFRRDPAFLVQEVAAGGVKLSGDDFDNAVASEVKKQVAELQLTFNHAVSDKVSEKLATIKADHDNALDALGKKLQAANDQIATLTAAAEQQPAPATVTGDPAPVATAEPEKKPAAKK